MTPKQQVRDRKRIRAALARAGKILVGLREEFEARADPYNCTGNVPQYMEWPEQLDLLDGCLDYLDTLIGNCTTERE